PSPPTDAPAGGEPDGPSPAPPGAPAADGEPVAADTPPARRRTPEQWRLVEDDDEPGVADEPPRRTWRERASAFAHAMRRAFVQMFGTDTPPPSLAEAVEDATGAAPAAGAQPGPLPSRAGDAPPDTRAGDLAPSPSTPPARPPATPAEDGGLDAPADGPGARGLLPRLIDALRAYLHVG
ncbi:MAG TPA: hypothetical protein VM582_00295, partial [Candidatus Thermoplasmatota archaeon]|nr:hypothetical protein [Candidatus Thermoplasmatota archaeon]